MDETYSTGEPANLTQHRAGVSVWDRRGWDGTRDRHDTARLLLGAGGGALMIQGLRMGTRNGRFLAGVGGSLAIWAFAGDGELAPVRQWFARAVEKARARDDAISTASDESFPASDAPSWTPTVGTGLRRTSGRR